MTYSQGLASLAARAKALKFFLWLFIGISALGIPIGLSAQFMSRSLSQSAVVTVGAVVLVYALISLIALVGVIVTLPIWTHRAWANLHVLGLNGLRYRPWWAALSFFVPIAGLFVPFFAMRELYNRSIGEEEDRANASAAEVTSWWTCFIAGSFITSFIVLTGLFNLNGRVFIVTSPIMDFALAIFGNLLMIGAAWFLTRTARDITAAKRPAAGISETFA